MPSRFYSRNGPVHNNRSSQNDRTKTYLRAVCDCACVKPKHGSSRRISFERLRIWVKCKQQTKKKIEKKRKQINILAKRADFRKIKSIVFASSSLSFCSLCYVVRVLLPAAGARFIFGYLFVGGNLLCNCIDNRTCPAYRYRCTF